MLAAVTGTETPRASAHQEPGCALGHKLHISVQCMLSKNKAEMCFVWRCCTEKAVSKGSGGIKPYVTPFEGRLSRTKMAI